MVGDVVVGGGGEAGELGEVVSAPNTQPSQ